MQRLTHATRFTYASTALDINGNVAVTLKTVIVNETDPAKALKKYNRKAAEKVNPLKTETVDILTYLSDDIYNALSVVIEENGTTLMDKAEADAICRAKILEYIEAKRAKETEGA